MPLLELPQAQFLLMSATLGDVTVLADDLTRRTGRSTSLISDAERPVPLLFEWSMTPLQERVVDLIQEQKAPVYIVHFTQAEALERAQALLSLNLITKHDATRIAEEIGAFRFGPGFGKILSGLVRRGIGVHHAGMLPKYRRLVEQLAQTGLLKVICGTDTLGVGINVPIRTVLFTGLSKYDGTRVRRLRSREFHQIAGRAGRAGFDTVGFVVVQAPEHVIENEKALAKAGDDPKARRKVVRRKPPEGFVGWNEETYERIVVAQPEQLVSRMQVTHATVLNIAQRPGSGADAMRTLIGSSHEPSGPQARAHPARPGADPRRCCTRACWSSSRRRTRTAAGAPWPRASATTSRSTNRWPRSPSPHWRCWTRTHPPTTSTSSPSWRRCWRTRSRCCWRSSSSRAARPWRR